MLLAYDDDDLLLLMLFMSSLALGFLLATGVLNAILGDGTVDPVTAALTSFRSFRWVPWGGTPFVTKPSLLRRPPMSLYWLKMLSLLVSYNIRNTKKLQYQHFCQDTVCMMEHMIVKDGRTNCLIIKGVDIDCWFWIFISYRVGHVGQLVSTRAQISQRPPRPLPYPFQVLPCYPECYGILNHVLALVPLKVHLLWPKNWVTLNKYNLRPGQPGQPGHSKSRSFSGWDKV